MLEQGRRYSRGEIGEILGGSLQQFLPTRGGKVLCGCFRRDLNPHAPLVVLVGIGPQRERSARAAERQASGIPVFVKDVEAPDLRSWEYVGRFRPTRYQTEGPEIATAALQAGREPIAGILYLEPEATGRP